MWLWLACVSVQPRSNVHPRLPQPADPQYEAARLRIERERTGLARRHAAGEDVTAEARVALTRSVTDVLLPEWEGTPWAYYGDAAHPDDGAIACGHFVARMLGHAGLDVEERRLGQQASEHILLTVTDPDDVQRFRLASADSVVDAAHGSGDGLYVLGLDHHAALLWVHGDSVDMCHSSPGQGVRCEDARTAPLFESNYRVFGPAFSDDTVDAWLEGRPIPTVTKQARATRS